MYCFSKVFSVVSIRFLTVFSEVFYDSKTGSGKGGYAASKQALDDIHRNTNDRLKMVWARERSNPPVGYSWWVTPNA